MPTPLTVMNLKSMNMSLQDMRGTAGQLTFGSLAAFPAFAPLPAAACFAVLPCTAVALLPAALPALPAALPCTVAPAGCWNSLTKFLRHVASCRNARHDFKLVPEWTAQQLHQGVSSCLLLLREVTF
jgi:hypothetical protein